MQRAQLDTEDGHCCPWIRSLFIGLLLVSPCWPQAVPKMIMITTRLVDPKAAPNSFSSQPKTCWRAGTRYARVAEAPDWQNHVHGLVIVNEPDVWVINLFDKSGTHMVDSGPTFNAELPIFDLPQGSKMKLSTLEFGREMGFVNKNGARRSPGGMLQGRRTSRYDLTVDGRKLTLWADIKTQMPVRISLAEHGHIQTIEYLAYDENLPFDPSLFRPPAGISITERR
jgi:hypothetical protein